MFWATGTKNFSKHCRDAKEVTMFVRRKWLPSARVVKLVATKDKRDEIMQKYLQPGKFDICLTSYEGVNLCKSHLKKFQWKYIVIDEAHKIKNEASVLSKVAVL